MNEFSIDSIKKTFIVDTNGPVGIIQLRKNEEISNIITFDQTLHLILLKSDAIQTCETLYNSSIKYRVQIYQTSLLDGCFRPI